MSQELKGDTLAEAKLEDITCSEFLQICKANVFLKKKKKHYHKIPPLPSQNQHHKQP
jgi:hypothetical protein